MQNPPSSSSRLAVAVPLSLLVMVLAFLAACGPDQTVARSAAIQVQPNPLTFQSAAVGDFSMNSFEIESVGDGPLLIESIEVVGGDGAFTLDSLFTFPMTIEPDADPVPVRIIFAPLDAGTLSAQVLIRSNALDQNEFFVDLQPPGTGAELFVDPDPVVFGRVSPGERAPLDVNIANNGTSGIILYGMNVSGSAEFELTGDGGVQLPHLLAPNEFITIEITYSPDSDGFDEGVLVIEHLAEGADTSGDFERKFVTLSANGTDPCVTVTHEAEGYDFRQRMIGRSVEEVFTITNCGDDIAGQTVAISGFEWSVAHDWFSFSAPSTLDSPLELENLDAGIDVELEPGEYRSFIVTFEPADEGVAHGVLSIETNDPLKNPLEIDIRGVGSTNVCPVAVAVCQVRGTGVASDEVGAIPLDYIECDGSGSFDEGAVASYMWEVVARPEGSTAEFSPSSDIVDPSFFLDLAGRYVFRLNVVDDEGSVSCEPSDVTVVATPNEAILVQLTWDTPADDDITDNNGSDLDLHFSLDGTDWGDCDSDVFWGNDVANWGSPTRGDDDPSLDIDDTDGAGPEDINLDNPEGGGLYRVGVHNFNDHGFGISYATVRIFINGVEAYVRADKPLDNSDNEIGKDFWEVATIAWPTGEIVEVDEVIDFDTTMRRCE